jgi:hypothetical protein
MYTVQVLVVMDLPMSHGSFSECPKQTASEPGNTSSETIVVGGQPLRTALFPGSNTAWTTHP